MNALRIAAIFFALALVSPAWAGPALDDVRLGPLKELDGYFPFTPPATKEAWAARRAQVQRDLQVALGLWPLPERTPLHAVRHGQRDLGDYTLEAVYFESMPGFFVTGSLYLPKSVPAGAKLPVVLCPYGHWIHGRFMENSEADVQKLYESGAEKFEAAAKSHLQARCVQLARLGCAVLNYDMIGKADCTQIGEEVAHKFARQRPEMISPERWGLFSPQAEGNFQSIPGLQTWNSMRAIDFMLTLPRVDPQRVAVTGASGGATQTLLVSALDPRVTVAFPAVMVSTAMQGGCTCENASGLRVHTGNVEIAALFAPKPMGMTAANDWTKEMETKGFPQLQQLWGLLGAPEKVSLHANLQFPHNYNAVSRAQMYEVMVRELPLPKLTPERDFKFQSAAELTVWDAQHPQPPGGDDFERGLLAWWKRDADRQLATPRALREIGGPAVESLLGRSYAAAGAVEHELTGKEDRGDYFRMTGLVRNHTYGEVLPALYFFPKKWRGATVLWLDEQGKAGLLDGAGDPRPEVARLLRYGVGVIGVDLLYQGDFLAPGEKMEQTRTSTNKRQAPAFTYCYNESLFAQRVHDILSVRKMVEGSPRHTKHFSLVAPGVMGPIAAAARALAPEKFNSAIIGNADFRFMNVRDYRDPQFLPGGAKYGDLPGLLALGSPNPVYLLGAKEIPAATTALYEMEAPGGARIWTGNDLGSAVTWLAGTQP